MAWTAPTTRTTGTLITASIWNTDLVDNLSALKSPPTDTYTANEGSDYSTTSATFVNVDGTNLSHSITTTGGDVIIHFHGNCTSGSGVLALNVTVDGSLTAGDDGIIAKQSLTSSPPGIPITFTRLVQGLSAASHTFNLQYKVSSGTGVIYAGAGTGSSDLHPQFWVREV